MASNWTVCGVCDSQEITKPSVIWCSECDEGLCAECDKHHAVSRASRTHNLIPIAKYKQLPIDVLKITHTCSKHNEKYQIYCRKHDCPCCHRCVIETHNDCKDITAIVDIIKGVKSSNALSNIEQILVEVAENLEKITKDRKDNLKSVKDQRSEIEKEIQQTRIKINCHLDQIQKGILKELNTKEEKERKKIEDLLTELEKKREKIDEYRKTISNIKQYASDLQTFLAIKQIENKVSNEERSLETLTNSESLMQTVLSLKNGGAFQMISNISSTGQIHVNMRPSEVVITRMKGKQAQLQIVSSSPRLIEDIQLNLKQTIKTGLKLMTGCLILPDGRLVLSCLEDHLVRFFSSDGKTDFEINLKPCNVFGITFIPEDNTIAATSGAYGSHNISIIDIKNRKVSKQFDVNFSYYGLVYSDARLIVCAKDRGLHILLNGDNKVVEEIKIKEMPSCSYVATFDNKLYYTNREQHTVTCCDMKGTTLWTIKDRKVLEYPQGVTVDNVGNVYVASASSCNVIVISSDGKRFLGLLGAKNDLHNPLLYYDRSTNHLLVGNENRTAYLFQVESEK